ncbi:unnamed protein product [Pleuronectes platessa]|uniref:Uncharacterized protein n=1 Tax=Pleuronectes platessa TaxID=8262 RepID=A0A9N7VML3_PLEPL|nr:unnamed protein product [Pleuronectes platessa]
MKSLHSCFGPKVDNIDNRLSDVANSIVAIEGKLSDVERDVAANATHIGEAETRVATTEDKLQHTQEALASATKRIAYLESKTEDLENRGRRKNLRIFGLRERAEGNRQRCQSGEGGTARSWTGLRQKNRRSGRALACHTNTTPASGDTLALGRSARP